MINEIRERLNKATQGPWTFAGESVCEIWAGDNNVVVGSTMDGGGIMFDCDGDFIANAPEDIKFLLDEIEKLNAELETCKTYSAMQSIQTKMLNKNNIELADKFMKYKMQNETIGYCKESAELANSEVNDQ